MKRLLFIILFLSLYSLGYAADINRVVEVGTTYSSNTSGTSSTTTGTEAECYDENDTTYLGRSGGGIDWSGTAHVDFQANFSAIPYEIHRIKGVLTNGGAGGWSGTWSIQYYDGSWHTLANGSSQVSGYTSDNTDLTLTNVTAVKIVIDSTSQPAGPPGSPASTASVVFELYVYGSPISNGYAFIMD